MTAISEWDLFDLNKSRVYTLDQKLKEMSLDITDVAEYLPGFVHLNSPRDISIQYANTEMTHTFELTLGDIQEMGLEFQEVYVHPESTEIVLPKLVPFVQQNDIHDVFSFFQAFRRDVDSPYEWCFSTSKISVKDGMILTLTNPVTSFGHLAKKILDIVEEDLFVQKHYAKFEQLTLREKQVLKLLAQGYTHQSISDQLFISKLTVKTHRQNICRKLEVSRITELIRYARGFGLI